MHVGPEKGASGEGWVEPIEEFWEVVMGKERSAMGSGHSDVECGLSQRCVRLASDAEQMARLGFG